MSRSLAEFEVVRRGLRRERFWRAQVDRALSALTLDKAERRIICSALFDRPTRGPLLLGNQHVRNASRTSMVSTMCDLFESEPGRKLYLITGGGLRGVKTLGDPSTDLVVFERAIDKKLRRHHLSGLLSFEFDIVKPRGNETDYPVLWHAHGLVGREDGLPIGFEELRNTFAASRAFPSWNDGVGLHVKPVRRTIADLARSAAYLADPIHQLKVRYPDPKRPSRLKMRSTRSGFPPSIILRGTEIQSALRLTDIVFGVGPLGALLRSRWRDVVATELPVVVARGEDLASGALAEVWARINAQYEGCAFQPPEVVTRSFKYAEMKLQRSFETR